MVNFYKSCQDIIKDIVAAFNSMYELWAPQPPQLSKCSSHPKKVGDDKIMNSRPISQIHSFAKIHSKLLALHLRSLTHLLISVNQSAFISGRSIQDNFLYVWNLIRCYHRNISPSLLFKLNISKAFDSVRQDYLLLSLLHQRGSHSGGQTGQSPS